MKDCERWESLEQLFCALNRSEKYLVLRNYEELHTAAFLTGHSDVDFLCESRKSFCAQAKARPRFSRDDGIHYAVCVGAQDIPIDVRCVGDGYYDARWAGAMLSSRVQQPLGFYAPSKEQYFYSLLYHVLIHKQEISSDYLDRLPQMEKALGLQVGGVESWSESLAEFMRRHRYCYTNTRDCAIGINRKNIPSTMIRIRLDWQLHRAYYCARDLLAHAVKEFVRKR